ncbi:hypothetical protein ABT030_50845 [Streptomyces mirabilis]|uniref:hypothetical protein n=1 Tax=Streptomyces mirabilis TaxID=68239 RepID=UPI00332FEADF
MPSPFVLGVQQELRELVSGSAGASHVAGDGRGDPVPVLGRVLAVCAQDHAPAVGAEPAVTARRVAAREVAEQDEIGRTRRELGQGICRWRSGWWVLSVTVGSSRKDVDAAQAR